MLVLEYIFQLLFLNNNIEKCALNYAGGGGGLVLLLRMGYQAGKRWGPQSRYIVWGHYEPRLLSFLLYIHCVIC